VAVPKGLSTAPGHIDMEYFPNSSALSTAHMGFWVDNPDALIEAVRGNVRKAPPEL
jgi:hypothetical protein